MMQPLFIEGGAGSLFVLLHEPATPLDGQPALVYVPPFAEESNRSRRMAALTARTLSAAGIGVLLLDLFGTGDSAGDFGDAGWDTWVNDVTSGALWLRDAGYGTVGFLGLRTGAGLGLQAWRESPDLMDLAVLWQPVTSGRTFFNQFLRLRLAAEMTDSPAGGARGTKALRSALEDGEAVEIAGYSISNRVATGLEGVRLTELAPTRGQVHWFDVVTSLDLGIPPASQKVIDTWRERGVTLGHQLIHGQHFWLSPEITVLQPLIDTTTDCLKNHWTQ